MRWKDGTIVTASTYLANTKLPDGTKASIQTERKEEYMNELYEAIEQKIKASGYPRAISGEEVYNDICDQIDGKENGTYLLLSKFEEDVVFEYHITIQDEDFNLGILTMRTPEGVFEADFDAWIN